MHDEPPRNTWFGCNARKVIEVFPVIFPTTTRFYFISYVPQPGVRHRVNVGGSQADPTAEDLVAAHDAGTDIVTEMLKDVDVDETSDGEEVEASEMASRLDQLYAGFGARGEALALYPRCRDESGGELHIPMMDFRIKSGNDAGRRDLLCTALRRLGRRKGVLLNSGNSYHYYGFELLTPDKWKRFMAKWLLLAPLVEVRYIAHRMLAGKASLRLNEVSEKKEPEVVACLDQGRLACCGLGNEMKA